MILKQIQNNGWLNYISREKNDKELLKIASEYGTPFPDSNENLIQQLESKPKENGIKQSLSYNYGLSNFPYHTDTSFINIPARYFLLSSVLKSKTSTNIVDFYDILDKLSNKEIKTMENSIFLLKTPQESKFTKMLFKINSVVGVRFDPNIMTPYNRNAKDTMELLESHLTITKPIEINWSNQNVLIVDNWRCLHSRSKVKDDKRILKRIYIK